MACVGIWFAIISTCGGVRSNGVGQNRETNEEYDEDWVEEGLQLAKVQFDKDGAGGREALCMGTVVSIFEMDQNWN